MAHKKFQYFVASLVVKNPPAMRETWVWFLGWEDAPEKENATHSSIVSMVNNNKHVGLKSFKTVAKEFKNIGK